MTLDEAIINLGCILELATPGDSPEDHDAIKLGIEAFYRIQECRKADPTVAFTLLPSETLE